LRKENRSKQHAVESDLLLLLLFLSSFLPCSRGSSPSLSRRIHYALSQDELHGLADGGSDQASTRFDGRVLYDEASSSTSTSSSSFAPRLLAFDEPDALGPGLFSGSSPHHHAALALDDDVALAASAATWGGRAVGVQGGAATTTPSAFAAALAAAEREERRKRRQGGGGANPSSSSSFAEDQLASAARSLSLSGGVTSWADFLKAPLAKAGTVHSEKALGWLPPFPPPPQKKANSSSSSSSSLSFVPGARRPGWGPPSDPHHRDHSSSAGGILEAVEEGARRLAERCDRLGGFLTLADDARGWGSTAAGALALLRDEYPRSPRILFALRPPDTLFGSSSGSGGSGEKSKVSASAAAAAFSAGYLAPLADLFVPLSPPPALWASPSGYSESPCDALFRWSAAAAAAVDAATTPLRLLRGGGGSAPPSCPSSSFAQGGFSAASLAALLSGPRGGSLAALCAALPLAGVPETGQQQRTQQQRTQQQRTQQQQQQQQQQRERERERGRAEGGEGFGNGRLLWASPPAVRCWTPGISSEKKPEGGGGGGGGEGGGGEARSLFAEGSLLAESVTVRGALLSSSSSLASSLASSSRSRRRRCRRLSAPEALSELEAALASEGIRAVRQLCASSAPLHLPLPFPEDLLPRWCYERSGGRSSGKDGEEEGEGLGGAPLLVRLAASRALSSLARDSADLLTLGGAGGEKSSSSAAAAAAAHASGLRSSRAGRGEGSAGSLAGSLLPLFNSWGVDSEDAAASAESSRELESEYRGGGSDGVLSSGDDSDEG